MARALLRVVSLAAALVAVFVGTAQAAPAAEPAVITVLPYYDNGNGIWDPGEPLIKGLIVSVQTAEGAGRQEHMVGARGAVFKVAAGVTQNIWIAQNIAFSSELGAGDYDYVLFVPAYDIALNPWDSLKSFPRGSSTVEMPVQIKLFTGYESSLYEGPLPDFRYVRTPMK